MYISIEQLADSLKKLDFSHSFFGISFLAFKELDLPTGAPRHVDIANQEKSILETYYNPLPNSKYYYIPQESGSVLKHRWVSKSTYPDGRLEKTRTITLRDAFLHPTPNEWAWSPNYLQILTHLQGVVKIPAFHLAVWMFRDHRWPDNTQPEGYRREKLNLPLLCLTTSL